MALISFWASLVFYNSYLPDIAYPDQQDIASARGFSYGYIGSVILLLINLIISSIIPFLIWGPFFPDLIVSVSTIFFLYHLQKMIFSMTDLHDEKEIFLIYLLWHENCLF